MLIFYYLEFVKYLVYSYYVYNNITGLLLNKYKFIKRLLNT